MTAKDARAQSPRGFVRSGQWPHADLADHHGARVAQTLARHLAAEMHRRELSANRLAAAAGLNRQTIANVLAGTGWPDLLTIASLELALDTDLWPGRAP
ncbi:helix-turn-helix domain-containing protein [Streptomyces sp. NBC_01808]|uniref:helix-turn-helix transcriptional regulator n=1 Tax=Streptomyces sp. NBC_01808 TaxID=2975947 RepID=UPI002DDA86F6|nr:helix-turn-helix transcriptional regulator [Streptomyces sp. NBC_01808]WSA39083.1 helix-turn-helix domain-containing protein [Streptomyces sp. NBC_01808]